MKKLIKKIIDFILSLFIKDNKEEDNSGLVPLKINSLNIEKHGNDNFHLKINFSLEDKDQIDSIIVKVKGDRKETGYIQCSHLTYDDPTKIQPLCGKRLPAIFELKPQDNILNLDYEAPLFILVDMISKQLDLEVQLISKKGDYYFMGDSKIEKIQFIV